MDFSPNLGLLGLLPIIPSTKSEKTNHDQEKTVVYVYIYMYILCRYIYIYCIYIHIHIHTYRINMNKPNGMTGFSKPHEPQHQPSSQRRLALRGTCSLRMFKVILSNYSS